MKLDLKTIFVFVLLLVAGFWGGYFFNQKINIEPQQGTDFTPLFKSWQQIENKFYKFSEQTADILKQEMLYGAIEGMVQSLNDPYSDFLRPEESLQLQEDLSGSYEGIGAEIGIQDNRPTIISPIKGTPAESAGIMAGDKILEINGESTEEMTLTQAVMKIRGKAGTEVNLKIDRNGEILEIKVQRAKIDIPTSDFKMLDNNIAYIQLYNFYEDATAEFKTISQEILNSGTDKIILDLRNNPGGYLSVATDIGNLFIERGKVILKENKGKSGIDEILSTGPGAFSQFQVVILINEGSASASEILAGAIKENNPHNTTIIGKTSFGKGTVQEFIPLKDGSSLKLTIAGWLLPSGESIDGKGISPDIEVEMTEEDIKAGRDPQLEKAIEQLISL